MGVANDVIRSFERLVADYYATTHELPKLPWYVTLLNQRDYYVKTNNIKLSDHDKQETLAEYKTGALKLKTIYDGLVNESKIKVGFNIDSKGYVTYPGFIQSIDRFYANIGKPNKHFIFDDSSLGKQDVSLSLNIDCNYNIFNPSDTSAPTLADFKVKTKNDVSHMDASGSVKVNFAQGIVQDANFILDSDMGYKSEAYPIARGQVLGLIESFENSLRASEDMIPEVEQVTSLIKQDIDKLVPKMHELGDVHFGIDTTLRFDGDRRKLEIGRLEFVNDQYMLVVDANLDKSLDGVMPAGQLNFKINSYDVLIDRLSDVVPFVVKLNAMKGYPVNQQVFEDFGPKSKQLLNSLAQQPNEESQNLMLNIAFLEQEPFIQVNGQDINLVAQNSMEIFNIR